MIRVAFAVVGLDVEALFWLFAVLVLFGVTVATGARRGDVSRR